MMIKKLFPVFFSLAVTIMIFAQDTERKKFDPSSDPFKDLKTTVQEAKKENKNIILDVGGEWCIWCHRIDAFMEENREIKEMLARNFIILKVNFSKENKNEKFLSQYPKIDGYPHFFVLDKNGKLLHSQNTGELEAEKSYSRDKFVEFLKKWSPKKEKS
jgi:thioredoxin-related protein